MDALNQAVLLVGGVGALAARLGVGQSVVSNWRARGSVAQDACPAIEQIVAGRVQCEALRPDVVWRRVPDAEWPWHPNGRPLIDVTRRHQQEARDAA